MPLHNEGLPFLLPSPVAYDFPSALRQVQSELTNCETTEWLTSQPLCICNIKHSTDILHFHWDLFYPSPGLCKGWL